MQLFLPIWTLSTVAKRRIERMLYQIHSYTNSASNLRYLPFTAYRPILEFFILRSARHWTWYRIYTEKKIYLQNFTPKFHGLTTDSQSEVSVLSLSELHLYKYQINNRHS